jgi:hypothetical protein
MFGRVVRPHRLTGTLLAVHERLEFLPESSSFGSEHRQVAVRVAVDAEEPQAREAGVSMVPIELREAELVEIDEFCEISEGDALECAHHRILHAGWKSTSGDRHRMGGKPEHPLGEDVHPVTSRHRQLRGATAEQMVHEIDAGVPGTDDEHPPPTANGPGNSPTSAIGRSRSHRATANGRTTASVASRTDAAGTSCHSTWPGPT